MVAKSIGLTGIQEQGQGVSYIKANPKKKNAHVAHSNTYVIIMHFGEIVSKAIELGLTEDVIDQAFQDFQYAKFKDNQRDVNRFKLTDSQLENIRSDMTFTVKKKSNLIDLTGFPKQLPENVAAAMKKKSMGAGSQSMHPIRFSAMGVKSPAPSVASANKMNIPLSQGDDIPDFEFDE